MSLQLASPKIQSQRSGILSDELRTIQKSLIASTNSLSYARIGYPHFIKQSLNERLFDAKANCKIKMSEVSMYLTEEWRKNLNTQIDDLMDVENWDDEDKPVTTASFSTFMKMITFLKPAKLPGLGSAYNGNLIAAWTETDARLTIECFPNDSVRWVLSHIIDGMRESGAGISYIARLKSVLSPYNPERWFGNDN